MQAFSIPTEGDNDADATTHEVIHGMSQSNLQDWLNAIKEAGANEVADMVRDGLAAATEVKDREAFVAIRAAGKKREAVA
jgi:hypothetical protein